MMSEFEPDRKPVLGCIADDVTGATDLAINLVNGGWRVVQLLGTPQTESDQELAKSADAVVVALKTRSVDPEFAQRESVTALKYLRELGADRFYFKYCSTFDSTREGNIGPVSEALMAELGCDMTVYCPAFPQAGRTVYQGHLFVADQLLHESGMQHHPLNPMTDSNLVRFLSQQVKDTVGLVPASTVEVGCEAVRTQVNALSQAGCKHLVLDAVSDGHLRVLAEAIADKKLLTGGSGLGRFLPAAYQTVGIGQTN
ncbi:MAG: four-carbon acid sugar kinase family protein, partial [Planctomycetota bacterium]